MTWDRDPCLSNGQMSRGRATLLSPLNGDPPTTSDKDAMVVAPVARLAPLVPRSACVSLRERVDMGGRSAFHVTLSLRVAKYARVFTARSVRVHERFHRGSARRLWDRALDEIRSASIWLLIFSEIQQTGCTKMHDLLSRGPYGCFRTSAGLSVHGIHCVSAVERLIRDALKAARTLPPCRCRCARASSTVQWHVPHKPSLRGALLHVSRPGMSDHTSKAIEEDGSNCGTCTDQGCQPLQYPGASVAGRGIAAGDWPCIDILIRIAEATFLGDDGGRNPPTATMHPVVFTSSTLSPGEPQMQTMEWQGSQH
jgi:hypothetical protein